MVHHGGPTSSLSKQGQIVGLTNIRWNLRLPLVKVSVSTKVAVST